LNANDEPNAGDEEYDCLGCNNFDSGLPIAKVIGGDMAGKVLHLDSGDSKKVKSFKNFAY
jgi:hypothetical protein